MSQDDDQIFDPKEEIDDFSAPDPPEAPEAEVPNDDTGTSSPPELPDLPTETDDGTPINYTEAAQNNEQVRELANTIKDVASHFQKEAQPAAEIPQTDDLLRRIEDLERIVATLQPQQLDREGEQPDPYVFCGAGASTGAWAEKGPLNAAIVTLSGGRAGSSDFKLIEASSEFMVIDYPVPANSTSSRVERICFPRIIPVRLTSDGGVSGTNKSAVCTFTYTVKERTNTTTLGTTVALTGKGNGWRALKLALTAGTYGWAYYDHTGTLLLLFADEIPAGEQDCS